LCPVTPWRAWTAVSTILSSFRSGIRASLAKKATLLQKDRSCFLVALFDISHAAGGTARHDLGTVTNSLGTFTDSFAAKGSKFSITFKGTDVADLTLGPASAIMIFAGVNTTKGLFGDSLPQHPFPARCICSAGVGNGRRRRSRNPNLFVVVCSVAGSDFSKFGEPVVIAGNSEHDLPARALFHRFGNGTHLLTPLPPMIWVISQKARNRGVIIGHWNYPAPLAHYKFKIGTSRNFNLQS